MFENLGQLTGLTSLMSLSAPLGNFSKPVMYSLATVHKNNHMCSVTWCCVWLIYNNEKGKSYVWKARARRMFSGHSLTEETLLRRVTKYYGLEGAKGEASSAHSKVFREVAAIVLVGGATLS